MNVYCVYWGDKYHPDYVPRLRDQVARNLSIPHEFRCITDREFSDVDCVEPVCDFPGWWQKIGLFKPGFIKGQSLYLDLDVVIVGRLDDLVEASIPKPGVLACPENWAQSGHGGCQSSVMLWQGDSCQVIWDEFNPAWAHWPPRNEPGVFWGDQEWITHQRDTGRLKVAHTKPEYVVSYKYHCRNGLPADARAVVFHGKPDPHEVSEPWMS